MTPWIPVEGRDAGPHYPSYLNPATVVEVTFWTDPGQHRVATARLADGREVELRERAAIDALGTLTKGTGTEPAPAPARPCARR